MEEVKKYKPVSDGWKDGVKPRFAEVTEDHFNENSLVVSISFDMGAGFESPIAKLPLVYASDHKIVKWENGNKVEHVATAADQMAAYSLLANLFPDWAKYCSEAHTTNEKLHWFENDGREVVLGTSMDIKVKHSSSGFPNAIVKDPTHTSIRREKTTKASVLQRAADTFSQFFGSSDVQSNGTSDDSDIPF